MTPRPLLLPLLKLLGFTLCLHNVASFCSHSCSTDYMETVNCSCTASPLPVQASPLPVHVQVVCSGEDLNVSSSCEILLPLTWCSMLLDDLDSVASVGTQCTSTMTQHDSDMAESKNWSLADVVKPAAPFDVTVTNIQSFYNISWNDTNPEKHCLTYRVRLRERPHPKKDSAQSFTTEQRSLLLAKRALCPRVDYVVDVQARMCPDYLYQGPWSEWSAAAAWRVEEEEDGAPVECHEADWTWWHICLPVVVVLVLLLMGFRFTPCWQRKLEVIAYIPQPGDFFKPLYHSYGGNFKEWVKPVFSEYDYLHVASSSPCSLGLKQNLSGYGDGEDEGELHHHPLPQPSDDGGTSPSISLHTVVLSGDHLQQEVLVGSIQDHQEGPQRSSRSSVQRPQEPERVSLDSFVSTDPSEDSYPHMDLDTVDSGFGESSDPHQEDPEDQKNRENQKSNYVRQWVIGSIATPD
ncbi:interleukin-21 receptor-like [Gouania willdenowi]|uniref:Interleukin-21 receptor-like n=1 Tax=Gouania willdenowi TaxID=441366 RepID=A0A8C5E0N8_GOUWI|nr:interleukin-21 receptor-like [Gouania willdenowi]